MSWDELDELLFGRIGRARFIADPTGSQLKVSVTKLGARVPVSTDQAMDEGLIPDTRPACPRRTPIRVTPWTLARARARDTVATGRVRLGSWIAGVDLAEWDDDEEDW